MISNLVELKSSLRDRAKELLVALFEPPRNSSSREWRWGSNGSISYNFTRHTFADFEGVHRGSLLDAIMHRYSFDLVQAVSWAREWLDERATIRVPTREPAYDADAEKQKRLGVAQALWTVSTHATGTPAGKYLEARGIGTLPCNVRFVGQWDVAQIDGLSWWSHCTLMFPITDATGGMMAIQLVALHDDGSAVVEPTGKRKKRILGPKGNGVTRLSGDPSGPLVIVEGGETGLAVQCATDMEVWCCLGVINSKIDLSGVPLDRLIVIAADDDAMIPMAPSMKAVHEARKKWRQEGRHVVVVYPWARRRYDKSDFADVLKDHGPDAVREPFTVLTPPPPREPGLPLKEARNVLAVLMRSTIANLLATSWQRNDVSGPPVAQIVASLGLGKTHEALHEALRLIEENIKPIVISTPTHELNGQLLDRARRMAEAQGSRARIEVRLGRDAIDPQSGSEQTMCLDLDAVREGMDAGLAVQANVCEQRSSDGTLAKCRFFDVCSFQKQRVKTADLWLVSHAALGHARPTEVGHPQLLIVDENPINALLMGTGQWVTVSTGDLAPVVRNGAGGIDSVRTVELETDYRELATVRRKVSGIRERNGHGPIQREVVTDITVNELRKAAGQAQSRIVRPNILRGMGQQERQERLKGAGNNNALLREAKLYELLADFIDGDDPSSGHVRVTTQTDRAGSSHEVFRLTYMAKVATGWAAPTLLLDATARPEYRFAVRAAFPGLRDDLGGEVRAAMPDLRVTVLTDRSMALGAIRLDTKGRAQEVATWAASRLRALGGGRALVVGNKLLADAVHEKRLCHVEVAHFNALRGRDEWRTARLEVIVGRTQPPPDAVEVIVGAITGRAVKPIVGWYERETRPLVVGDKVVSTQEADRHPDAMAEAVRWQICEGEVLQAERLRAVERTADTPADLVLWGCPVPDGLQVDAVETYQAPSPAERMLAAGGVALRSAPAAARAYPDLWKNVGQVKDALRSREWVSPIGILIGETHPLVEVKYQLIGERQRPAAAQVDLDMVPDPRTWLEERLGPLASFSMSDGAPSRPPKAEPKRGDAKLLEAVIVAATQLPKVDMSACRKDA